MSQNLPQTLAALSRISESVAARYGPAGWTDTMRELPTKTLRTAYAFAQRVGFGQDGTDPSGLVEAVADEIATREKSRANRAKFARRRGRGGR